MTEVAVPTSAAPSPPDVTSPSLGSCVLLVDDDPLVRRSTADALRVEGYEVLEAEGGAQALGLLRKRSVDVVLSDVSMPEMSGHEFCEAAQTIHPDLPVILVTGFPSVDRAVAGLQSGALDYITKPVSFQDLPIVIERNLVRRHLEAHRLRERQAQVLMEAIHALAEAIDARHPSTAGHSRRVAAMARRLGWAMGLDDMALFILQLAGEMHDVGKIGVSDAVLSCDGPLDPVGEREMRKHPEIGSRILRPISELSAVASIVRHHHEWVDGSGYPDGLYGSAIPLEARILSVADAWDAITSGRPYRDPRSDAEALAELRSWAGVQFDPVVVAVFAELIYPQLESPGR